MNNPQLGDARSGKLVDNLTAFGRALRRAGVPVDASRIVLAQQALLATGMANKLDVGAALSAVLVSREQDRAVFAELFDAFFRNPEIAQKMLAQMLPTAQGKAEATRRRPRVMEALQPQRRFGEQAKPTADDKKIDFDAAMTASSVQRLRHADFNALSGAEYQLVERLARDIPLPLPMVNCRRSRVAPGGTQLHWAGLAHRAAQTGGEWLHLPRLAPRQQAVPLLVLVDVSGSMERYARLLLAYLHAATRQHRRRDMFAFGTHLTDLSPAFKLADPDAMLAQASTLIDDFAGGTQLGTSLTTLRQQHARRFVGRRTLVLLISDGLDTGEPGLLAREMAWLQRASRRVVWLNPLMRYDAYAPLAQGAAVLHHHSHAMLAVHNLTSLEQLAASLAAVMRR